MLQCRHKVFHLARRRQWQATPVLLPRKSHGWRSLVGYSPWGRHELVVTERLHFHFSLSRNGEGNGNPLQCSFLENPRDCRAWWAAVYGVAQSRIRLKQLSSSSSSSSFFLLPDLYKHSSFLPFGNPLCALCTNLSFESQLWLSLGQLLWQNLLVPLIPLCQQNRDFVQTGVAQLVILTSLVSLKL